MTIARETRIVAEIIVAYKEHQLILEPAFQRSHAWKYEARRALLESMLANQPIPEVVLFHANDHQGVIVIDGKPPLHLLLGPDAFERAQKEIESLQSEFVAWEAVTRSTNFEQND